MTRHERCLESSRGRGLPSNVSAVSELVCRRKGVQELSAEVPLAAGVRVRSLRVEGRALDDCTRLPALPSVRERDFGNGRHDVRPYADASADLVCRDLVSDEPEGRGKRIGSAAGSWGRQLSDGLDVAA